jgi:multidrug efflux system membrane fusion protein
MRLKPAYIVVIVIVAVVFAYLLLRPFLGKTDKSEQAAAQTPAAAAAAANAPPLVETTLTPQIMHPYMVDVRGRTQAARTVEVRSETAGDVASTPILQGTFVRQGTVLCRLAVDARRASLDEAMANMKSKKLQMQASASLAAKGFRSPTQVLTDQAALDAATAGVRAAQVALDQVNIRAPFTGVFDHREAEVGAYLAPGQPCGAMIELDPLLIVGDVPETEAGKVHVGATATAKLVSGEAISGRVRFVAHDADPATRTYRVEITSANAGNRVRSGLSADVQIGAGVGPAHLVPVSALVLDAAGQQGVRYVMADGVVAFAPVTVLDETPSGVWVSGLAGPTRVITVGQSYVSQGQKVRVAAR